MPTSEHHTDSSSWLLSYSDVMTLLFALFVMLFAYQRVFKEEPAKIAKIQNMVQVATTIPVVAKEMTPPKVVSAPPVQQTDEPAKSEEPAHPVVIATPRQPETNQSAEMLNPIAVKEAASPSDGSVASVAVPLNADQRQERPYSTPEKSEPEPVWLVHSDTVAVNHNTPPETLTRMLPEGEWGKMVEYSQSEGKVRLEINDSILFDPASAKLKPQGSIILDQLGHWLNLQVGRIEIEGHTDNRPIKTSRFNSNWELATARASMVTRYLIARGIPPERLRAVGLADTQPRETNDTTEGRARNRRVSVVVYIPREEGIKI
jgi:chemotaxis protein MotB